MQASVLCSRFIKTLIASDYGRENIEITALFLDFCAARFCRLFRRHAEHEATQHFEDILTFVFIDALNGRATPNDIHATMLVQQRLDLTARGYRSAFPCTYRCFDTPYRCDQCGLKRTPMLRDVANDALRRIFEHMKEVRTERLYYLGDNDVF